MSHVTTVIPVFNGERHLPVTLDSLAAQTRRPDRVVIINDASTDRTEEVAMSHPVIRCEVRENPRNLGLFPNHNRVLELAPECELLHLLHANDTIHPEFYARMVPPLENAPVRSLAWCRHRFISDDGAPVGIAPPDESGPARPCSRQSFLAGQAELRSLQLHSVLLKTGHQAAPVQFPLDFPQLGDVVFHAAWGAVAPELWEVPRTLVNMRLHAGSASSRNARSLQAFVTDEWRTMQYVTQLMQEPAPGRWIRHHRLSVLFAARTRVKLQMFQSDPEYSAQIRRALHERVGFLHRIAGDLAVSVRDICFPKTSQH
jgi:glycosyltransferase involved in cell wall biosynthesis